MAMFVHLTSEKNVASISGAVIRTASSGHLPEPAGYGWGLRGRFASPHAFNRWLTPPTLCLLLCLSLAASGCVWPVRVGENLALEGHIVDAASKQPLADVNVQLQGIPLHQWGPLIDDCAALRQYAEAEADYTYSTPVVLDETETGADGIYQLASKRKTKLFVILPDVIPPDYAYHRIVIEGKGYVREVLGVSTACPALLASMRRIELRPTQ